MKLFFNGLGGALRGGLLGFGGFFVLGLIASLTSAHPITNLFGKLGVLVLLGGIVLGFISGVKEGKAAAVKSAAARSRAEQVRKTLESAVATIRRGYDSRSVESMRAYEEACSNLIYFCGERACDPALRTVTAPFRKACYERTYTVLVYRNGRYEPLIGTELAEEIQKKMRQTAKEQQAAYDRRSSY